MTQIEQIKAEIERLMKWKPKAIPSGMRQRDVINIRKSVLLTLKEFINSLPAEQPSEDLEEAANLYANKQGLELKPFARRFFIAGAQWQKEQMMKSAIDAVVVNDETSGCVVDCEQGCLVLEPHTYPMGQKLKILIIKEDKQ